MGEALGTDPMQARKRCRGPVIQGAVWTAMVIVILPLSHDGRRHDHRWSPDRIRPKDFSRVGLQGQRYIASQRMAIEMPP
jgi:hypothetical protein